MSDETKPTKTHTNSVGYRNPPEHTRFKKGQSGNPRGRPRGMPNLATVLARTLREKVIINEHGQRRVVTKLEAAIKQLVNKAAAGELGAMRQLAGLVQSSEEQAAQTPLGSAPLNEDDQKVLQGILERFGNGIRGGDENESEDK